MFADIELHRVPKFGHIHQEEDLLIDPMYTLSHYPQPTIDIYLQHLFQESNKSPLNHVNPYFSHVVLLLRQTAGKEWPTFPVCHLPEYS